MKKIITKPIAKLSLLVISVMLTQGCSSLNEAAKNFNRTVLSPINAKLDTVCENQGGIKCGESWYRDRGYISVYDSNLEEWKWHNPKPIEAFFNMCKKERFNCGNAHYDLHPNWELRGTTYVNLAYGKKTKASLKEYARHEDNYKQTIKTGTKICKVNEGFKDEVGFTERFVDGKIQIRLRDNNHLIWNDAINWYPCNK